MHRAYGLGLYTLFVPEALALPVVQDDQGCYLMFNIRVSSQQIPVLILGDSMAPLLSCEHLCMDCGCHLLGYDLSVSPARALWNLQGLKPGSAVNLLLVCVDMVIMLHLT